MIIGWALLITSGLLFISGMIYFVQMSTNKHPVNIWTILILIGLYVASGSLFVRYLEFKKANAEFVVEMSNAQVSKRNERD